MLKLDENDIIIYNNNVNILRRIIYSIVKIQPAYEGSVHLTVSLTTGFHITGNEDLQWN